MTDWRGRQGGPEAEGRGRPVGNDRQKARARNQRGVVPIRSTHAPGKQSGGTLGRRKADCVTERVIQLCTVLKTLKVCAVKIKFSL